jgi:ribosome-binding factor A
VTRRTDRMGDVVRAELSDLLLRQIHDPRIKLVSVVAVELSPDLRHALVKVSALGDEAQRKEAIDGLQHARGFLRTELSRRLSTRVTPELTFTLDRGAEHSLRISELLEELHERDDDEGT